MSGSCHEYIVYRSASSGDAPTYNETSAAPDALLTMMRNGIILEPMSIEVTAEEEAPPRVSQSPAAAGE